MVASKAVLSKIVLIMISKDLVVALILTIHDPYWPGHLITQRLSSHWRRLEVFLKRQDRVTVPKGLLPTI